MKRYCEEIDMSGKLESKNKRVQSLTHNDYAKWIRIKHTIDNLDFFDIEKIFIDYMTNHNKKSDLYLVIYDSKIVLDKKFYAQVKSEFQYNSTIFMMKDFY